MRLTVHEFRSMDPVCGCQIRRNSRTKSWLYNIQHYVLGSIFIWILLVHTVSCDQRFMEEPSDQAVIAGSTATMKCAVADMVGELQWTKDGFGLGVERDLPGYKRYSMIGSKQNEPGTLYESWEAYLMIESARLEDDAMYQCQVGATENTAGIRSRNAVLSVLLPPDRPTINGGPLLTVTAGKTMNITCTSENGKPAPNITWYSQGKKITEKVQYYAAMQNDHKRQDATSILTITPTKADQGREYECRVMNAALFNARKAQASLDVWYPPDVTMTVNPAKGLKEYQTVSFKCDGRGNPNKVSWKWFRDTTEIFGENSNYLELTHVMRSYHGNMITCEGSNEVGGTRQSYRLNIEYGPKFGKDPKHVEVDPGQSATLECKIDGNPQPTIIWRKKGSEHILSSKETMTISDVRNHDFGAYICSATVQGFDEIEYEIHILKKGPPKIRSNRDQYAKTGSKAKVTCTTISVPKPQKIVWARGENPLDVKVNPRYSVVEEDFLSGRKSYLNIDAVGKDDFGEFNCTVANDYGQDSMLIKLLEEETVPLAYVLGGVFGGVVVIVLVALGLFICNRRKNDRQGETSEPKDEPVVAPKENSHKKSKSKQNGDIKVKYDPENNRYSTSLEPWQKDPNQGYYRYSAEYDELSYSKDHPNPKSTTNGGFNVNQTGGGSTGNGPDIRADYEGSIKRESGGQVPYKDRYETYGDRLPPPPPPAGGKYIYSMDYDDGGSGRDTPNKSRYSTNV
ncbi:kin of IRRE-like protein 1 isoform X3 [Lineus longissimus]|uniref:kin of IRRE-like protein 1 isoform X3 n=1 Tax=Lineus longissimus TaxID=88925 RepID=UPI00315CE2E3